MLLGYITWNVDPYIVHWGETGGIRWYGLLWAVGLTFALDMFAKSTRIVVSTIDRNCNSADKFTKRKSPS